MPSRSIEKSVPEMCCRSGLDQLLPRMTDLHSVRMGYTPKPRFRGFGGVRAPARLPVRTVPGIRSGGILSSTEVTKNGANLWFAHLSSRHRASHACDYDSRLHCHAGVRSGSAERKPASDRHAADGRPAPDERDRVDLASACRSPSAYLAGSAAARPTRRALGVQWSGGAQSPWRRAEHLQRMLSGWSSQERLPQ